MKSPKHSKSANQTSLFILLEWGTIIYSVPDAIRICTIRGFPIRCGDHSTMGLGHMCSEAEQCDMCHNIFSERGCYNPWYTWTSFCRLHNEGRHHSIRLVDRVWGLCRHYLVWRGLQLICNKWNHTTLGTQQAPVLNQPGVTHVQR
ncbi:hypothetical protein FGIG_09402 [Fasciola gigantica]|uniref:Uncharacterized protein n=1 Tax=Fasciola gigantica TaxID=46835 RepID=A0A504Y6R1_FASGI|nr:hypothetical protein FGIG_09402 [Fasciola gigantica]